MTTKIFCDGNFSHNGQSLLLKNHMHRCNLAELLTLPYRISLIANKLNLAMIAAYIIAIQKSKFANIQFCEIDQSESGR